MKINRRAVAAATLALLSFATLAQAQEWQPEKPIRLIVPFAPGGATDIIARVLGNKLSTLLGQQVVIDNRSGAGGIIGTSLVKEAAPDGYTLLMATIGYGANPALYRHKKLPYDVLKDFTPISQVDVVPTVLVVPPSLGIRTAKDLIAAVKSKPGMMTYGSAGYGTINHLAGEYVKALAGLQMTHVPYRSGGGSVAAVVSGEINMLFATTPSAIAFINNGNLIPLATSGSDRIALLPDVPPLSATIPGLDVVEWQGIIGPANMPRQVVDRLNREIVAALKDPAMLKRLGELGAVPIGSSPQAFDVFIKAEVAKWFKVADQTGMKAED